MARMCFVNKCPSYFKSSEKVSLFKIKDPHRISLWRMLLPSSGVGEVFTKDSFVCEKHFRSEDIIRKWVASDKSVEIPMKKPTLKPNAVPCIFSNYLQRDQPKDPLELMSEPNEENLEYNDELTDNKGNESTVTILNIEGANIPENLCKLKTALPSPDETSYDDNCSRVQFDATLTAFDTIWVSYLKLPSVKWSAIRYTVNHIRTLGIAEFRLRQYPNSSFQMIRQIILSEDMTVKLFLGDKQMDLEMLQRFDLDEEVKNYKDFSDMVKEFSSLYVCIGGPNEREYDFDPEIIDFAAIDRTFKAWRHKKCELLTSAGQRCHSCKGLHGTFRVKKKRMSTNKIKKVYRSVPDEAKPEIERLKKMLIAERRARINAQKRYTNLMDLVK